MIVELFNIQITNPPKLPTMFYTKETLIGSEYRIKNLFTNNKSTAVAMAESILKMHNDIMNFFFK